MDVFVALDSGDVVPGKLVKEGAAWTWVEWAGGKDAFDIDNVFKTKDEAIAWLQESVKDCESQLAVFNAALEKLR